MSLGNRCGFYSGRDVYRTSDLSCEVSIQCSLDYTEKYHLDYTENKAHSLGVRKTVGVLSHKLSKPLMTFILTSNYIPQANVVQPFINKKRQLNFKRQFSATPFL